MVSILHQIPGWPRGNLTQREKIQLLRHSLLGMVAMAKVEAEGGSKAWENAAKTAEELLEETE